MKDLTPHWQSFSHYPSLTLPTHIYSILCQTADLKIDPIWSCRFLFKSTPTNPGWKRGGAVVTGQLQQAMALYFDRLRRVQGDLGQERGFLYLTVSFKYTLCCQPKSWRTVFSQPEGELAILNPLSNIEQLVGVSLVWSSANFGTAIKASTEKGNRYQLLL